MKIYIENETGTRFDFRGYKKLIENVIETTAKEKNIPDGLEVNVMLVSPEEIRQINNETRNTDRVTDVLSFPYFEFEEPGIFDKSFFENHFLNDESASDSTENINFESNKEISSLNNDKDPVEETADIFENYEPETMLGDIVICAEKVIEQAETYGHSQKRELAFLIVHSMLHLIGYDHMNDDDEKHMTDEADKLMKILGISREI